jgi:hypothetical protein
VARALAFDVTDAGVLGVGEEGTVVGPSPGYALVEEGSVHVGREALARARLRPRFVMSRFWERLDAVPLGRPFPEGLTAADLVHAHLGSLWEEVRDGVDEVVLAVPGFHGAEALGRLLGIAQALEMPVVGLVDTAVAAATAGFSGERLLLADVGLHRATVTELRQGDEIVRQRVATIERWGLEEVRDTLARRIAQAFVHKTRFDPFHVAETEQVLHDRLPGWLERLAREDRLTLSLSGGGRDHEVEVERAEVEEWARKYAEELAQKVTLLKHPGQPTSLLVSAHAARIPGLVARLAGMRGSEVALVPEPAAAAGALNARERLHAVKGGRRLFVTRLERSHGDQAAPDAGAIHRRAPTLPSSVPGPIGGGTRPTHVLLGHRARALTDDPLVVGTAPPEGARGLRLAGETAGISRAHCRLFEVGGEVVLEDLSTYGTFVNGEPVTGRAVVIPGDRIRVGSPGQELLVIAVEA